MSKMDIAERDRPKVKAECLRLMVTSKVDHARMVLIASFVDRYLRLNAVEDQLFNQSLAKADLLPEQREEVVEILTSWELKGIEKGLEKGMEKGMEKGLSQGRREGALEALQSMLLDQITERFGPPKKATTKAIRNISSADDLRRLVRRAPHAASLKELGF